MQVIYETDTFHTSKASCLTIGSFDGVHLGHKNLFATMHQMKEKDHLNAIVTFIGHPSRVINPEREKCYLTDLATKIFLLEQIGIDLLFLFSFTKELAALPYDAFIKKVRKKFPFSHLILGERAAFGKNREGTKEKLVPLSKKLAFSMHYIPLNQLDGKTISSSLIREKIQQKDFTMVEKLLGRPYGCYINDYQQSKKDDHYLIETDLPSICLPPSGKYEVLLENSLVPLRLNGHHLSLYLKEPKEEAFTIYFSDLSAL